MLDLSSYTLVHGIAAVFGAVVCLIFGRAVVHRIQDLIQEAKTCMDPALPRIDQHKYCLQKAWSWFSESETARLAVGEFLIGLAILLQHWYVSVRWYLYRHDGTAAAVDWLAPISLVAASSAMLGAALMAWVYSGLDAQILRGLIWWAGMAGVLVTSLTWILTQ